VGLEFFVESNGYHNSETMTVAELHVGEATTFNDSGFHSIVRVK